MESLAGVEPARALSAQEALFIEKTREEVARSRVEEAEDLDAPRIALAEAETRVRATTAAAQRESEAAKLAAGALEEHLSMLSPEQREMLGRDWPRAFVWVVYVGAAVVEYYAFGTALLVWDLTEFHAYILAATVLAPVFAAHLAGASLKRLVIRQADPERRVGVASASPFLSLAGIVLVLHFALALLRHWSLADGHAGPVLPLSILMIMTLGAAFVAGAAAYQWTNPLQDDVDALQRSAAEATRAHDRAVAERDVERQATAGLRERIRSIRDEHRAKRETIAAHGRLLGARVRLANPAFYGPVAPEADPIDAAMSAVPELGLLTHDLVAAAGDPPQVVGSDRDDDDYVDLIALEDPDDVSSTEESQTPSTIELAG